MEVRQADRVADALEEMVFAGLFTKGQRLDEARLARAFGVSRTPVREALQRLVAFKLARQLPRRGVFVEHPDAEQVAEMFETMAEVEGVCGRLAAQRITPEMLQTLETINNACTAAIEVDDHAAYAHHNERFHHALYQASGNAFLEAEAARLYRRLKPFRRVQLRKDGRMAASAAEHGGIIASLAAANANLAAEALRLHVASQGIEFYSHMAQLPTQTDLRAAS
ncbi:MAG: GntR family transcriptional regulator [Pseudomonadota bacterium]